MLSALIYLLICSQNCSGCTKFVKTHTVDIKQFSAYRPSPFFYTLNSGTVFSLNESVYGQMTSTHFWFLTRVVGMNNTYRVYDVFSHIMVWTAFPDIHYCTMPTD